MVSKTMMNNMTKIVDQFADLKESLEEVEIMANGEFDALPMLARPFAAPLKKKIEAKLVISKKLADKLEKSINSLDKKLN